MQVLAIAADLDDGELETTQSFGTVGYAPQGERSGWTYMGGYDSASAPGEGLTASFFRFGVDRAIAPGSTVTRAVLRLFGADTWAWDPSTDYEWIAAEDVADASRPTQRQDAPSLPTGRPITARVRWPASPPLDWTIGDWNETTDFAAVVQELVDRYAGLATGAHVQIFVFRDGGATDGEVAAEDWSSPASHPAELVLAWR